MSEIEASLLEKAQTVFREIPYIKLLGMELVDLKTGEAVVRLKMRDELRQPHGLLHGGATASVIDTAMAFAVITVLETGEKASTVDLTVHYLRPVIHYLRPVIDETITCTARVVKAGRRLLTISADVISDKEKLIATSLSTYSKVS
jgi:acyl-CoA thioesterase